MPLGHNVYVRLFISHKPKITHKCISCDAAPNCCTLPKAISQITAACSNVLFLLTSYIFLHILMYKAAH